MAAEKPQQDPFLAAIEAKIAAWTAVADAYRTASALDGPLGIDVKVPLIGVSATGSVGRLQARTQADLPVGVFRDRSLKDAIPIYLGAMRRKQTNKEIATGLLAGGFHTTADNFEATVATALFRLKHDGVVLRFPEGWDLASSYPDSLRSRLEKVAKPRQSARPKKPATRKGDTRSKQLALASENAPASDLKAVG